MKIALFKSVKYGWLTPFEWGDHREAPEGYVRASEYADVEFPPLEPQEVAQAQVDALNEHKRSIQANAQSEITAIDEKIAELLALPAPEES